MQATMSRMLLTAPKHALSRICRLNAFGIRKQIGLSRSKRQPELSGRSTKKACQLLRNRLFVEVCDGMVKSFASRTTFSVYRRNQKVIKPSINKAFKQIEVAVRRGFIA